MTDKITMERETLEALELMLGDFCVSGRATDATRALSRKVAAALAAQPAPAAVPLTDEQIAELWVDILSDTPASGIHETEGLSWARLARAIERAHGIAAGDKP